MRLFLTEVDLGFEIGSRIGIIECLFELNATFLVKIKQRHIKGLHALGTTGRHGCAQFIHRALENQLRDMWRVDQDLDSGNAPAVDTGYQSLGNHGTQVQRP